jgi:hypothetical protein
LPDLLRRAAALLAISIVGIAVLAPMAARSAPPISPEVSSLLEAADEADARLSEAQRGDLSIRELPGTYTLTGSGPGSVPESIADGVTVDEDGAPTASMEATLYQARVPAPAAPAPAAAPVTGAGVWDRLAMCESSGNWAANTGNGYYGGLQFSLGTWQQYGGTQYAAYPHEATREQQIAVAERLHAARGFQPWPACRVKLGLP